MERIIGANEASLGGAHHIGPLDAKLVGYFCIQITLILAILRVFAQVVQDAFPGIAKGVDGVYQGRKRYPG